jgi:hypothetical protein
MQQFFEVHHRSYYYNVPSALGYVVRKFNAQGQTLAEYGTGGRDDPPFQSKSACQRFILEALDMEGCYAA